MSDNEDAQAKDPKEALLELHRQEKKDLQAQITKLRHSVGRNDKRRKKEVTAEIEALELSLQEKHNKDLKDLDDSIQQACALKSKELEPNQTQQENVSQNEEDTKESRTTKASRRREQKERRERELSERIKAGQVNDADNVRLIEMKRVEDILATRELSLYEIPSDGDCMYKSIEHQLRLTRARSMTVEELRAMAANYIQQNKDDFLPFLTSADGESLLSDVEFEDYCNKIRNTKTWGGQPELRALSNSLQVPIEVIQAEGSSVQIGFNEFEGGKDPLILCYFHYAYQMGEHYNSVTPNKDEAEGDGGEEWRQGDKFMDK